MFPDHRPGPRERPLRFVRESARRSMARWSLAIAVLLVSPSLACAQSDRLEEPSFPELIDRLSESGGYFDTDNLISNERSFVNVLDRLEPVGGIYVGVGPEQNFNYIGRTRPRWAFILDVRRDNLLQVLLLEAVLAEAPTPRDYLHLLFARPQMGDEPGRDEEDRDRTSTDSLESLVAGLDRSVPDPELFGRYLAALLDRITDGFGVALAERDRIAVREIYQAFYEGQLDLRFRSHGRPMMRHHPTYGDLLTARTPEGELASFLARPDDYEFLRALVLAGKLVPVVGDFAGDHALRAIGAFAREQGERVTTFYTSNVEYYLWRQGSFGSFADNVRSLPIDRDALFVRACFDYGQRHPERSPSHRSAMLLQEIPSFLKLWDASAYRGYWDLCSLDYLRPR